MTIHLRALPVLSPLLASVIGLGLGCGGAEAPADDDNGISEPLALVPFVDAGPSELAARCPEPELFEPGVISSPDGHEYRIAFTPDGQTAIFGRSDEFFPESRQATLYMSELQDGVWSAPTVAPFSGNHPDLDPFFSSDGQRLYFTSIRPVDGQPRTDADLWVVERSGSGWGDPENLGPSVNSASDELFSSVTESGVIYFASDRPDGFGGFDIWRTNLSSTESGPENVGPTVNTDGFEFNPWISPDGRLMLLTALNRAGGYGAGDLYASVDFGAGFNPPMNLGPCVNTSADEYHAAPRLDTRQLFFARLHFDPVWIPGDLYVLDLRRLGANWLE